MGLEPGERTRRSRRAEERPEAVAGSSGGPKRERPQRHHRARADVVAKHYRAQHGFAVAPPALGHRERRRHRAASRMGLRARVGIVGFVGVRHHAVGKCRIDARSQRTGADDGSFLHAAQAPGKCNRFSARQEARTRNHRRQSVGQMMLAAFGNVRGQRSFQSACDIRAELARERRNIGLGLAQSNGSLRLSNCSTALRETGDT